MVLITVFSLVLDSASPMSSARDRKRKKKKERKKEEEIA